MMKRMIGVIVCIILPAIVWAQHLSGTVTDKKSGEPLFSATVGLTPESGKTVYTTTDLAGWYQFKKLLPGEYVLQVSYVGYKTYKNKVRVSSAGAMVNISMEEDIQLLGQVSVNGRATRAEQKGDSLVYNAEAFKVLQGSTAEELLAKMPGVVVEGGTVQAQGEDVKKVLVDGKEFFDGDINLALKNLPADIIASIEVFDKKSEQAEFTGFDDGEEIKTINIVTKSGFKEGTFGEVYGGYGTEDRYRVGGNVNFFDGDRRVSVLGMSNNVNQQNFSQEDLAGVMASSAGKGRGGRRKGGKAGGGPGNSANNFMVGNLGGITASNGLGLNYVDQWGEKVKVTGSYFFNQSVNNSEKITDRYFFDSVLPGMSYHETNSSRMENWNHRFNMKLDYQIDKNNSLQIRPVISFQNNDMTGMWLGSNLTDGAVESEVENNSYSDIDAYSVGGSMIYRHRFPVPGRTLSVTFNGTMSDKVGDVYSDYVNRQYGEQTVEESYGQYKATADKQYMWNGSLMFTEKLADAWQLQTNYRVSYSNVDADRKVYERAAVGDLYEQLDENLSNVYESDYLTHSGGVGLRFHQKQLNVMLGADFQYSSLMGNQYYPVYEDLNKKYFSVLPSATVRYTLDRSNSFILRYRSRSASPSVTDLQEVVDNTNPLFLTSGNPELDQQINHSLNLRYIRTTSSGHTFIAMAGATFQQNYVADSSFVAKEDMVLPSGVEMEKGSQYTKPVNLDGYYSFQSMLTYGFPLDIIRSNLNLSIAANYANVPTIFDGMKSATRELNVIPKIIIGSNISHNLDFTVSYSATINKIFNSVSGTSNGDYINHLAAAKLGWTFWKGFTFQTTFNYINYAGLDESDSDYFLWNASIGKKFLKHNQAEIRLEACDLLNQNQAFLHQIGSNYYDYINYNVLKPYLMLSFTYTIR